ncbi:hypothetical protein D3C71_1415880 [compost metagenome]
MCTSSAQSMTAAMMERDCATSATRPARASTGCWLKFRPACGRCAPKERGPSSSQRFSSAHARHKAHVPRGYGSGNGCGNRITDRGANADSRRSVSGSTAGDTQTRARSGRAPAARPSSATGSSGAAPGSQSTTVVFALSAGDSEPAAGKGRSATITSELGSNIGASACRNIGRVALI